MILENLLAQLENVTPRGGRHVATCPAHADRSPSLQITAGDKGLLLKCWSGCRLEEICASLGIRPADLFFDALNVDPRQRRDAARKREHEQRARKLRAHQHGRRIDALREADYHIRTRSGLDIGGWTDQKLDDELNVLADAYLLLASEPHAA